ncbi:addiction module HigA family antidote [Paraburkholderia sp. EB58]
MNEKLKRPKGKHQRKHRKHQEHYMTRQIPLATPGEILALDWLEPMGISQYALAKAIEVPARRINEIVKGDRSITADTAVRLGAFFGTDPQSWMNLQTHYDTEMAREKIGEEKLAVIKQHAATV